MSISLQGSVNDTNDDQSTAPPVDLPCIPIVIVAALGGHADLQQAYAKSHPWGILPPASNIRLRLIIMHPPL